MFVKNLVSVIALTALAAVAVSPFATAEEFRSTSFVTAVPADAEDCEWFVEYGFVPSCTPGMLGLGVSPSAFYWLPDAQLHQITKVRNTRAFCKGAQGRKLEKCLKGSHFVRTRIPTAEKCVYETQRDAKGNLGPVCVLNRYYAESGSLAPGNYALTLYKETLGQWKCSINYRDVCRWSDGYSLRDDILFTWTGSEVQSERVAASALIP